MHIHLFNFLVLIEFGFILDLHYFFFLTLQVHTGNETQSSNPEFGREVSKDDQKSFPPKIVAL